MRSDSTQSSSGFTEEHRLAWTLLLARACEKSGLNPFTLHTYHRLIYFANCLAEVYEFQPPSELVMKQEWGPYYPNAQMDLDRLVIMGLVDIEKLRWKRTKDRTWKSAEFSITSAGFSLSVQFSKDAKWFAEAESFLLDVCAAYASIREESADDAARNDLTYSQPGVSLGGVIVFSDRRRNPSALGANSFAHTAPALAVPNRQHQLRLYMKFLEGKAA